MTRVEAQKSFFSGEKVRHVSWEDGEYLQYKNGGAMGYGSKLFVTAMTSLFFKLCVGYDDGWEIVGDSPKLVRKEIADWSIGGGPVVRGDVGNTAFLKIHGYVYDCPNDPESDMVSMSPSLLWSVKHRAIVSSAPSDVILDGRVVRMLPVAVIVEE